MVVRPRWTWQLEPADGERPGPVFTARFDAEQWLGEHWRDLARAGTVSAQLLNEGVPVPPVVPLVAGAELPISGAADRT